MASKRVNAVSLRLGCSRAWNTIGFFDSIFYCFYCFMDWRFHVYMQGFFYRFGIQFFSNSVIKRRENQIDISIQYSATPTPLPLPSIKKRRGRRFVVKRGKLINKKMQVILTLFKNQQKVLSKSAPFFFSYHSKLQVYFRYHKPYFARRNAGLLCFYFAKKVRQRFQCKHIFNRFLILLKKESGSEVSLKFRYKGPRGRRVGRSAKYIVQHGNIPYGTAITNIDYCSKVIITKFGSVNIAVWLVLK